MNCMRHAIGLGLIAALTACAQDDGVQLSPFTPIGLPDMGPIDQGTDPDLGNTSVLPLKLSFEPIEHPNVGLRLTDLAFAPTQDGRFLVIDKDGGVVLMRLDGDAATELGRFEVPDCFIESDAGLIAVAFDPDFATNGFFYLGLTTSQETNVVRRYTLDAADFARSLDTETPILEVTGARSPRPWHNVGSIGFTDEGYLWALFGDKVLDEVALDPHSQLGAVLRVIPDRTPHPSAGGYTVPPDNPFVDGSGDPAVYAKGFRSPWKGLYVDGDIFVSDVGLDNWEEVNRVSAPGQSFGWPAIEGPCDDCGEHEAPWVHYGRGTSHPWVREDPEATSARLRSAWVGWHYVPNERDPYGGRWDDVLIFGEFYAGWIRGKRTDGRGATWHVGHRQYVTSWNQGPDGYVYMVSLGTWPTDAPVAPSVIMRAVLAP